MSRRIGRRIAELHLAGPDAYRAYLESHLEEWAVLDSFCRIPISRFLDDYEGIGGYESFRGGLVLMYFPALDVGTGELIRLTMTPLHIRRFRLNHAAPSARARLRNALDRGCRQFGPRVTLRDDTLDLAGWCGPPMAVRTSQHHHCGRITHRCERARRSPHGVHVRGGSKRMSHDALECFALPWPQYRAWFARHRDELVGRAPFYQPAWLEALAAALHFDLAPIGIERAGELIAIVPGFLTQRGPFRLFGSPLRGTMTSYLGPIGCLDLRRPEVRRELVEHASAFARRHWRVSYAEFALRGPVASTVPDGGWEAGRPGSYQIDLSRGEDGIWAALRPRARRQIRKSQQLGLEVAPFAGDAGDYYAMLLETFGRREATVWHPERFFRALFERLIPAGIVRVWSVRYEGETISAGIFVQDDREVHYVSGASRTAYRMLPTSYLMHWHAIRTAAAAGAAIYDFGGTGTASICEFKESFSPKRIEYWHLRWASAPARLARRVFLAAERRVRPLRTLRRRVRARRTGRSTPRAPA